MSPHNLVCTLAWPELSKTFAMKVGGCNSVNAFTIGDWKSMATKAGLGWPVVRERMAEVSHAVRNGLDAVRMQTAECNPEMANRLYELVGDRTARLLDALTN